jgi:Ca2+-binding EF-hand superfamily protein
MKRSLAVVALAVFSTLAAGAQEAGTHDQTDKNMFDSLDTDHNGYLNKDELQVSTSIKLKLEDVDADGDGKVSREELVAAFEKGSAKEGGAAGPTGEK